MRKNLKKFLRQCNRLGYPPVVRPAPVDAVTFDRIVVAFLDETRREIRTVSFYDSKTDTLTTKG